MANLMNFAGTMLKNLVSPPVTTKYPAEPIDYPERSRGHIENDFDNCILCGLCMRNCPTGTIKVSKPEGKWSINRFDCIQCGYCTLKCPKKCLHLVAGYQTPGPKKVEEVLTRPVEAPAPAGGNTAAQTVKMAVVRRVAFCSSRAFCCLGLR